MRKRNCWATSWRTGFPPDRLGKSGIVAAHHLNRGGVYQAPGVHDVRRLHQAFRADGEQITGVRRRGAPFVALHRLVHLEHAEDGIRSEGGHRTEGKLGPGAICRCPTAPTLARPREVFPILQVPAELPPLEDFGLPHPHVHPVRREEKEHPGLALVGWNLPGAFGGADGKPRQPRVCQEAHQGALGGSQKALVGFQQSGAHARGRQRWDRPRSTYMTPVRRSARRGGRSARVEPGARTGSALRDNDTRPSCRW